MRTLVAGEGWKYNKEFTSDAKENRTLFVGPQPPEVDKVADKSYLLEYWSHADSPAGAIYDLDIWKTEQEWVSKVVLCSSALDWSLDTLGDILPSSTLLLHSLERAVRFLGLVAYLEYAEMLAPNPSIEVHCILGSALSDKVALATIFHVCDTTLEKIPHTLRINNIPQLQEMTKELKNG